MTDDENPLHASDWWGRDEKDRAWAIAKWIYDAVLLGHLAMTMSDDDLRKALGVLQSETERRKEVRKELASFDALRRRVEPHD